MFANLLILATTVPPITRVGASCPLGYYTYGSYCVPTRTVTPNKQSINRIGTTCPLGTYTYSTYCTLNN